jgi:solute:Na+ symporter, SSS family
LAGRAVPVATAEGPLGEGAETFFSASRIRPFASYKVWNASKTGQISSNVAFVGPEGRWLVGMPSLWAWGLLFWALGLGLIWFLSYKMEMASPVDANIPAYDPPPSLRRDQRAAEHERLRVLVVTGAVGIALVVLMALSFGG